MNLPTVSVVITARNEYPVILPTIMSFYEELKHWGYDFELIVVDNGSTDSTPAILRDRFRRWVQDGTLKVVEYNERFGNVLVRNVGVRHAQGDAVVICDAHLSITTGTIHGLVQDWSRRGGLWHPAINVWGDTTDIGMLGYKIALKEKFWGSLSRHIPPRAVGQETPHPGLEEKWGATKLKPHRVAMASHCCLLVGREEYLEKRGYHEKFRTYGGGEPYLDLKWWLTGGEVWMEPRCRVRHATFSRARWVPVGHTKEYRSPQWVKGKGLEKVAHAGDEILRYGRGYSQNNEEVQHNFMLSAYTIGGYRWLQDVYARYYESRKGNPRYLKDIKQLRREVLAEGEEDRAWMERHQTRTLDELLEAEPWEQAELAESTVTL